MLRVISSAFLFAVFILANGHKQPHIIFIVADDLGWNDVSWQNPNIFTPNLELLASQGVILNQSYVQAVCTPSRVAFMTGYYPYKVGRQNHVLHPLVPTGVPLRFSFLPEKLKEAGYTTHLIGKWHLGYCNLSYTPTLRGFDTFFGFYNGALDYFSHTRSANRRGPNAKWNEADTDIGFDLRNNTRLSKKYNGVYSTTLLTSAAEQLITNRSPDDPMFLFFSFQSVHGPLQVPKIYEDMYSHIKDEKRKRYSVACGRNRSSVRRMVTAMDESVGILVKALKNRGYWENSLLIFTTDNGGQTIAGGNNWPLRGNKGTLWEGGSRALTFLHGYPLKKSGYVNEKLFHAVDWFPTILSIAGARPVSGLDGINQWEVISEDAKEVRNEIVYNIYDMEPPRAAIRIGDYKLIQGFPGKPAGWLAPADNLRPESVHCSIDESDGDRNITNTLRLYNIKTDPTERYNVAELFPHVVESIKKHLETLKEEMVGADDPAPDNRGDPKFWNGNFSPGWCTAS